jgi:hypothetical protein
MIDSRKPASTTNPEQLKSWLPVDAIIREGRPALTWMDFADVVLKEPFFHETVQRLSAIQKHQTQFTELDALLQLEKISDHLPPSAFIFHSSRCGSTLVANACRALDGSIVVSEAPVIDKLVSRFFTDAGPNSGKELLYMVLIKAAISAFGQRRLGNEKYLFVKFACTSSLQMSRLRQIFPTVPFVFLYRDPVEVMVSNLRAIPQWMRPESNPATAAAIVDVELNQVDAIGPEEFCARVLGRFFSEADSNRDSNISLINYNQLSSEVIVELIRSFGIEPTLREAAAIQEVTRLYSKDPNRTQVFVDDSELKKTSASPLVIEMAQKWARPSYERLSISK